MYQGSLLEMSNSVLPRVEKLSLVSFNCKGFNNGLSFLPVLLDSLMLSCYKSVGSLTRS